MPALNAQTLKQIKKKKKLIGFIGGYLIDDGALTLDELDRGLLRQMYLAQQGHVTRLGQVLVEMGYITPKQLERAMVRHARDRAHVLGSTRRRKK